MRLIHFVINISQKCMYSADVWKYRDSVLGHEDCLAANSKSTGPPQKSADDQTLCGLLPDSSSCSICCCGISGSSCNH